MPEVSNGRAPGRVTTGVAGLDDVTAGGLPPDCFYLVADTVILFRYFEAKGEVRRAISVVKNWTGRHERTIRELRLGPGIQLGVPFRQVQGVLSGVPTILQDDGVGQDGARL